MKSKLSRHTRRATHTPCVRVERVRAGIQNHARPTTTCRAPTWNDALIGSGVLGEGGNGTAYTDGPIVGRVGWGRHSRDVILVVDLLSEQ